MKNKNYSETLTLESYRCCCHRRICPSVVAEIVVLLPQPPLTNPRGNRRGRVIRAGEGRCHHIQVGESGCRQIGAGRVTAAGFKGGGGCPPTLPTPVVTVTSSHRRCLCGSGTARGGRTARTRPPPCLLRNRSRSLSRPLPATGHQKERREREKRGGGENNIRRRGGEKILKLLRGKRERRGEKFVERGYFRTWTI